MVNLNERKYHCSRGSGRIRSLTVVSYSTSLNRRYTIVSPDDTLRLKLARLDEIVRVRFYSGQNSSRTNRYNLNISYVEIEKPNYFRFSISYIKYTTLITSFYPMESTLVYQCSSVFYDVVQQKHDISQVASPSAFSAQLLESRTEQNSKIAKQQKFKRQNNS